MSTHDGMNDPGERSSSKPRDSKIWPHLKSIGFDRVSGIHLGFQYYECSCRVRQWLLWHSHELADLVGNSHQEVMNLLLIDRLCIKSFKKILAMCQRFHSDWTPTTPWNCCQISHSDWPSTAQWNCCQSLLVWQSFACCYHVTNFLTPG